MKYDDIVTFVMVLLALCGAISIIGNTINLLRNWKKESKLLAHENQLQNHENRIKVLEESKSNQEEYIKVMCNTVLALVSHEINGNSIDKLQHAQEELRAFLINR